MTLHEQRSRFEKLVAPFAEWCALRGITPNQLTFFSLGLSLAAAILLYISSPARAWALLAGALVLALSAFLDSADGVLARRTRKASKLGDFLDHAFDRFADVLILLALAFSPWVRLEIGLLAIVGTLLTSYMGTQAQAVGVGRDYGGIMGRADRMTLLIAAPVAQALLVLFGQQVPWGTNLLELVVAWIAIAGNITALQRFWGAYQELRETDQDA
ncbi:MAG: CDP-alcohol phosphatidyltransferase family protein [Candidatus Thermoplasmatota archaeon]|nr:CDP-alcohol phosphatidyltransferase family protein [Candidatus Thermoplasmatota archaeon]